LAKDFPIDFNARDVLGDLILEEEVRLLNMNGLEDHTTLTLNTA